MATLEGTLTKSIMKHQFYFLIYLHRTQEGCIKDAHFTVFCNTVYRTNLSEQWIQCRTCNIKKSDSILIFFKLQKDTGTTFYLKTEK